MELQMTESQKKFLMLLITILMAVLIFTMVAQPLQAEIKTNKKQAKAAKTEAMSMKNTIEDTTIEVEYEKLKKESQQTFDQNYQSFKANEKVEEILKNLGIPLKSITISPYSIIDETTYEKRVVQPKTMDEYNQMQATKSGELMKLFLVSNLQITVEATKEQQLQIINAINNIPPQGPGAGQRERYCMQIPTVTYSTEDQGNEATFLINMYGMEAPPIQ
ncbi:MAG: hypothetical protein RR678_08495 [Lachnospiraceae bacterium]